MATWNAGKWTYQAGKGYAENSSGDWTEHPADVSQDTSWKTFPWSDWSRRKGGCSFTMKDCLTYNQMAQTALCDKPDEVVYWISPGELEHFPTDGMEYKAEHILRNCFGKDGKVDLGLLEASEKEVVRRRHDIKKYIRKASLFIGRQLAGRVADLGAGTGTLTSIISRHENVRLVYAVEISESYVNRIMPLVFSATGADSSKIMRIVGDFNHLRFEDDSIDYIVENGAFHHSDDIGKTIAETWRVLKKGGWFIGIERSHENHMTNGELEKMLDREFGPALKAIYGIPEDQKTTRREWGEHELRHCDWNYHFAKRGFRAYVIRFFRPHGIAKGLKVFYWLFGNIMLNRRICNIPYLNSGHLRTLVLAQKP